MYVAILGAKEAKKKALFYQEKIQTVIEMKK